MLIALENPTWEDLSLEWGKPVELYQWPEGDEAAVWWGAVEVEKRVSPLRRQSAPPPVEMTVLVFGEESRASRFLRCGGKVRRLRSK